MEQISPMFAEAARLAQLGGPVGVALGALAVAALAIALWKLWRFAALGVWSSGGARRALKLWKAGERANAIAEAQKSRGAVARVVAAAMRSADRERTDLAREEAERVGKSVLADLRVGLRGLETITTVAPLLGLLGTVLGMISAFQALQDAGGRADPSTLAGGIWEAMLTTAAGMAVAIPAGVALNWCESVVERVRLGIEDAATQVFTVLPKPAPAQSDERDAA